MSISRVLLLGLVLVMVVVFVFGIGLGVRSSGDQSTSGDWVGSLGNLLVQPARAADLTPSPASCLEGEEMVVSQPVPCTYELKTSFLAKRVRARFADGSRAGLTAAFTLTQPGILVGTKQLRPADADPISLTYQKQGSSLAVGCLDVPPSTALCRLILVTG
jgi:hypothetical protein